MMGFMIIQKFSFSMMKQKYKFPEEKELLYNKEIKLKLEFETKKIKKFL